MKPQQGNCRPCPGTEPQLELDVVASQTLNFETQNNTLLSGLFELQGTAGNKGFTERRRVNLKNWSHGPNFGAPAREWFRAGCRAHRRAVHIPLHTTARIISSCYRQPVRSACLRCILRHPRLRTPCLQKGGPLLSNNHQEFAAPPE